MVASTVKIMQDGVMENFTAAMSDPYHVDGLPTGVPMIDPEFLKEAVTALDAEGFQVHFHAIGDAAITHSFDAVAAAIDANGMHIVDTIYRICRRLTLVIFHGFESWT